MFILNKEKAYTTNYNILHYAYVVADNITGVQVMNLKDLEYFVAVAEKGSFSRAAECCNASQPTISNSISRMEKELGASLFRRSTRTLALTDKGTEILAYAQSILVCMRMIREVADTEEVINRCMHLGITTSLSHYLYTQVVNSLDGLTERPVKVHEISKDNFKTQIDSGKMHCILSACDENFSLYEKKLVAEFPYVLAVSSEDPLADSKEISLDELKDRMVLGIQDSNSLDTSQNRILLKHGLDFKKDIIFTTTEVLKMALLQKREIALIPQYAVRKDEKIKYIPLRGTAIKKKLYLIHRGDTTEDEVFARLASEIGKAIIPVSESFSDVF